MKRFILSVIVSLAIFFSMHSSRGENTGSPGVADIIIFSYDRPLQLCALLESLDNHVNGLGDIFVIYRTSSPEYERAYQTCFDFFTHRSLKPIKQQNVTDFKLLTLEALRACSHEHILFAVDDIIVKDAVDLGECVAYLKRTGAHGFYLRLGENISESYADPKHKFNPIPAHQIIDDTIVRWIFKDGIGEWRYPNTVDMTVYDKAAVLKFFEKVSFDSPNVLEAHWAHEGLQRDLDKSGLCYKESKIINVPFNLVQGNWQSRNMGHTKEEFLRIFNDGFKIDTARYFKFPNKAPHVEAPLYLVPDRELL